MNKVSKNHLNMIVEEVKNDSEMLALILFGSTARKDNYKQSDVYICLVLMPRSFTPKELSQKKLAYLKSFILDIQVFQQLPLYIKRRVLKEGKILHCKDDDALYDLSFTVIREFADFENIYRDYLVEVWEVADVR